MSFWKSDKPTKFTSFEEAPLKDGALLDAVVKIAEGESIPRAVIESITGVNMDDPTNTKPAVASKLNGIGTLLTVFGGALIPVFTDPGVQQAIAQVETILPAAWIPWITMLFGIGTVIVRTFFTKKPISGVVTQQ